MIDTKADPFRASKFHTNRRSRREIVVSAVVLLTLGSTALALAPVTALAHAIVVTARPAMNAAVAAGELDIRLDFNSRIDHKRSAITLQRPDGSKSAVVLATNSSPSALAGRAQTTMTGPWKLYWQVLSLDGHVTRGEVVFLVRDGGQAR